jgi:hypothetical protein
MPTANMSARTIIRLRRCRLLHPIRPSERTAKTMNSLSCRSVVCVCLCVCVCVCLCALIVDFRIFIRLCAHDLCAARRPGSSSSFAPERYLRCCQGLSRALQLRPLLCQMLQVPPVCRALQKLKSPLTTIRLLTQQIRLRRKWPMRRYLLIQPRICRSHSQTQPQQLQRLPPCISSSHLPPDWESLRTQLQARCSCRHTQRPPLRRPRLPVPLEPRALLPHLLRGQLQAAAGGGASVVSGRCASMCDEMWSRPALQRRCVRPCALWV